MCLIVYSKNGALVPRAVFDYAKDQNGDGIGVMSARGVNKYLGKKSARKAWRELETLSAAGIPYGLHFRWATHGEVYRHLCHPFYAPESDAMVMHNGVISKTTAESTAHMSDTLVYVAKYMRGAPQPHEELADAYYKHVEQDIGYGSKFLIFHSLSGKFTLCNERAGNWHNDFWYSNTYSLPKGFIPVPVYQGGYYQGGYWSNGKWFANNTTGHGSWGGYDDDDVGPRSTPSLPYQGHRTGGTVTPINRHGVTHDDYRTRRESAYADGTPDAKVPTVHRRMMFVERRRVEAELILMGIIQYMEVIALSDSDVLELAAAVDIEVSSVIELDSEHRIVRRPGYAARSHNSTSNIVKLAKELARDKGLLIEDAEVIETAPVVTFEPIANTYDTVMQDSLPLAAAERTKSVALLAYERACQAAASITAELSQATRDAVEDAEVNRLDQLADAEAAEHATSCVFHNIRSECDCGANGEKEIAAPIDICPITADDKAWLRNQQLAKFLANSDKGESMLTDEGRDVYREALKRAAKVAH